jgi:HPt (histidine-containing phosphotransfer) domain-containing protein
MGIDFDHLKRYTGEDTDLINEVLGMFSSQTEMWLRGLDPTSDDETWSGVAHALKGSAQTVGAARLGELCDRAEAMVGEDVRPKREWIAGEIEAEVETLQTDIQRWQYETEMKAMRG